MQPPGSAGQGPECCLPTLFSAMMISWGKRQEGERGSVSTAARVCGDGNDTRIQTIRKAAWSTCYFPPPLSSSPSLLRKDNIHSWWVGKERKEVRSSYGFFSRVCQSAVKKL